MKSNVFMILFAVFIFACEGEKENTPIIFSHTDSFPPYYTDAFIGTYPSSEYYRYGVKDSNNNWVITDVFSRTLDLHISRKAFDTIPNAIYIEGFQFEDIPCRVKPDSTFSGGMSTPQWSRSFNGKFKNDSIYIYAQMGHLGTVFHNYLGKRK